MMKNKIYHIILLLAAAFFVSCGDPSPTQLISEEDENTGTDNVVIESIPNDPSTIDYSNGYDSTGMPDPVLQYANIINLSGMKTTLGNYFDRKGFYAAEFKNLNDTILAPNGRLIGHRSMFFGRVFFDNDSARAFPRKVRYRLGEQLIHVPAGFMHIINLYAGNNSHGSVFPYNSQVEFRVDPLFGQTITHTIPTPPEITGNVFVSGSRQARNLNMRLVWTQAPGGEIEIILGGRLRDKGENFPLIRIKTPDNGRVDVPRGILESIPYDRFDMLVITFIRKYEFRNRISNLENNLIISQSIHNIIVQLP